MRYNHVHEPLDPHHALHGSTEQSIEAPALLDIQFFYLNLRSGAQLHELHTIES